MDENLGLRTELIQTKCQLARQSQSSNLVDSVCVAQQALEKVLLDVEGIKNGLEDSLQAGINTSSDGSDIQLVNDRVSTSAMLVQEVLKRRSRNEGGWI